MKETIQVAFASCSDDLIPTLIEKLTALEPGLPLYVVAEFPPPAGRWVRWHVGRCLSDNLALCRAAFAGKRIRFIGLVLQPRMPYWRMRLAAFLLAPLRTVFFNENLDHFMLRPRSLPVMARHFLWRLKNLARWELRPGGTVYTWLWRFAHPRSFRRPLLYRAALLAGAAAAIVKKMTPPEREQPAGPPLPPGISVVIPSRNGRDLLARLLPTLLRELEAIEAEVIVVDNGSDDATAAWLSENYRRIRIESSTGPLSFARAVNRGWGAARFSHVLFLNNDMVLEQGFFAPLRRAFEQVPDLFSATAQILFPEGQRRQETGKAVMRQAAPEDFPVRCEEPIPGEDLSYVLYGSGGCTLYDAAKLRALDGLREIFEPAYVEDLDLGYRAWQRGWASVFVAGARLVHHHRATTSRYYTPRELERVLERNYLRFLAASVASPELFQRLWMHAIARLNRMAGKMDPSRPALAALAEARHAPAWVHARPVAVADEELVLALASGAVAVFPGRAASGKPLVLIASPYAPFPLSHGGAVRMYNLMRRAAENVDQVLVCFVDELATPPPELLDICCEIVQVKRPGSHILPDHGRPDVVEEFSLPAFRAALRQTVRKWRPAIAQLEFTQMAQYAADCAPARTILVEHDVTMDLYQQLLAQKEDWEVRRQWERWVRFETAAWRQVDAVVTMSEKDRKVVTSGSAVCLPNGVDLKRFQPSAEDPESRRLLFIGSFAHLPNLMAVEFFLREVWPLLASRDPILHIIAGARHRYYMDSYQDRVRVDLDRPGIEVQDFVPDPRPAYRRATVVIAPLVASAGTNIKILEAMAMGKAIVSTPAGINGLDELEPGRDVLVVRSAREMSEAIAALLADPDHRRAIEQRARVKVERRYGWDAIAARQASLCRQLCNTGSLVRKRVDPVA